ncbi:Thiol-specific monooxygenase [Colletotrichum orbiculare MAFF 240422]|uniref:Thiol-specific monooxygenase n=1 Tax=Colletotrichum orbiculare (strain 104-T / ATCC 96160 / CBS 514.97 / LARS 414 / MAFF 240422) TaxID=1213857 RepID=N4VNA8_COLOR|nr:Thiol-specific monooxygenase [Colletotrichum orbiculare MAFF 240422]
MGGERKIKSVAVIGAGAAGAVTAAALKAEEFFDTIRVFERRESAGGTWIYDPNPAELPPLQPGLLPPQLDPALQIPTALPQVKPHSTAQERFSQTPIYQTLTTNVPDVAMSFSDSRFAYGPFAPHWVPRQYIENYFSQHRTDKNLELNTTVEDVTRIPAPDRPEQWRLTLRKFDAARNVDVWWEEIFDAVIFANGHYSVPYVPRVKGLDDYIRRFPGRVVHSKTYRVPHPYTGKKVVVVGNSASGHDVTAELVGHAAEPVYQSRRTKSRWDGKEPPPGQAWKPIIREFLPSGRVVFDDDSYLDGVDHVIYCTGYKASYPFWNSEANRQRPLYDYAKGKLVKTYWHTFFQDFATLGIVGMPRVLTFRSFEYQAVALARLFAGRNAAALPPVEEQERWEREREELVERERRKFHDIPWDNGETTEWLTGLYRIAGLPTLRGKGRAPPVLTDEMVWALENLKKYPEPGDDEEEEGRRITSAGRVAGQKQGVWKLPERTKKDLLSFI